MLLGTLTVEVVADTKGVNSGFKSMNSNMNKVGTQGVASMAALGGAVAGVTNQLIGMAKRGINLVIRSLKNLASESISLASSAIEMKNLFEVSFAGMGEAANTMSAELAKSIRVADSTMNRMLGTWGRFARSVGLSDSQMMKMGKELVLRAGDFASLNDIVGGAPVAMKMFQAAMQGQTKQLRNQGVAISLESQSYRDLVKSIMATEGVVIDVAKAMAIQMQIMEKTSISIGDLSRTSGTYANQLREVGENTIALKESFGKIILVGLQLHKLFAAINVTLKLPGMKTGLAIVLGLSTAALGLGVIIFALAVAIGMAFIATLAWTYANISATKAMLAGAVMSKFTTMATIAKTAAHWRDTIAIYANAKATGMMSAALRRTIAVFIAAKVALWGMAASAWTAAAGLYAIILPLLAIIAIGLVLFVVVRRIMNALMGVDNSAMTLASTFDDLKLSFIGFAALIIELGVSLKDFGLLVVTVFRVVLVTIWEALKLMGRAFFRFFVFVGNAISDIAIGLSMMGTGQEPDFSRLRLGWHRFTKDMKKDARSLAKEVGKSVSGIHLGSTDSFMDRMGKRILKLSGEGPADPYNKKGGKGKAESVWDKRQAPSALEGSSEAFKIITGAINTGPEEDNKKANERTAKNTEDIAVNGITVRNSKTVSMA